MRIAFSAALCGAVAAEYDDTSMLPAYIVVTITLVVLAVIDLEHFLLPNRIVYPLAFVSMRGALAAVGDDNWDAYTRGLLAGAIVFAIFFVLHVVSPRHGLRRREALVRARALAGVAGLGEMFVGLFLGFLYGAFIGLRADRHAIRAHDQALPFGPFLAAGTMTAILVGTAILAYTGS